MCAAGTRLAGAAWTVRTATGATVHVSYNASQTGAAASHALVYVTRGAAVTQRSVTSQGSHMPVSQCALGTQWH